MRAKNSTRRLQGHHCQCASCGEQFNSTTAFDRHRVGRPGVDRRCLSEFEMRLVCMSISSTGWWIASPYARLSHRHPSRSGDRSSPLEPQLTVPRVACAAS